MAPASRSRLVAVGCLLSAFCLLAVASPAAAKKNKFTLGVAAGDVTQHSAILWAHAKKAGKAEVKVKKGGAPRCEQPLGSGPKAKAKKKHDFTLRKKVKGLKAGTKYRFRFCMTGSIIASKVGSFETAPAKGKAKTIRFAWTGDYDAQPTPGQKNPFWNNFDVFKRMQGEHNDFNVALGDTIYSDSEVPGATAGEIALTKKQKWGKYRRNLEQAKLGKLRGSASLYSQWDDHEFINNFAPGQTSFSTSTYSSLNGPATTVPVSIDGQTLYQRGKQAFKDYAPTSSSNLGLYRTFRWGKNVEAFFLDERSFRSNLASYNHVCDNPSTGEPDLAPTFPPAKRAQFSVLIPSLSQPVSQQCLDTINDPNRTMLGQAQLARFKKDVASSTATWKVIFNELPIQQYYTDPYDRWEGYEAERQSVLRFLQTNVKNVVFLSTDVHANFVNDARFKTFESGGPENSGILDITTGPVATATYALEVDRATFTGASGVLYNQILKPQPPQGVGMQCAALDRFSYGEAKATAQQLTIDLTDIDGQPVQETAGGDVQGTCPPIVLNAQP